MQLGQQDLLQPGIEHESVTIPLKAHGGQQPGLMQPGDQTDPMRFGPGHLPPHGLPPRGSRIPALQRVIHPTFIKIDKVLGRQGGQVMLKLSAGVLVAFGVSQGFFFESAASGDRLSKWPLR